MAITLATATRNAACDAEVDLVDAGATAGTVEIRTSGESVLATLTCADPAFGDAATGVATANSITPVSASGTGTADHYVVFDSNSVERWRGTCGVGSGDMQLNTTSISTGVQVSITSWTHTVPAS